MGKVTKVSPVLPDVVDDEDKRALNSRVLSEVLQYAKVEPVYKDAEIQNRTAEYFNRCVAEGIKPTWEEYVLSLGVTARTVNNWINGQSSKVRPDTILKAKEIIASFDAKLVVDGKINPVTYFFRAKNYYGMRDSQEVVLTPGNNQEPDRETLISDAQALPTGD